MADVKPEFMMNVGCTLADYSVAIAYSEDAQAAKFKPIGSGVFIRKGNRFGILTARHCLHGSGREVRLGPNGSGALFLAIQRGRSVTVDARSAFEHQLAVPVSEEFGPDLAFVEILPGVHLSSIKAISSFWPLDEQSAAVARDFPKIGRLFIAIGFPSFFYKTIIEGNFISHQIHHMTYYFAIESDTVSERDKWDYMEYTTWHGKGSELPESFAGMSGGPVWGLRFDVSEADRSFSLKSFVLIGINFYQTEMNNNERRLRAHFANSIYNLAWENVN